MTLPRVDTASPLQTQPVQRVRPEVKVPSAAFLEWRQEGLGEDTWSLKGFGGAGTPKAKVTATNERTGVVSDQSSDLFKAEVYSDGSFSVRFKANVGDPLVFTFRDAAGNVAVLGPVRFDPSADFPRELA